MQLFDVVIIESSARCNLKCTMCPRLSFSPGNGDMALDTFEKIESYLHLTNGIDLTGWGEPLLNKNLFEMIDRATAKGCWVHFLTNATLLNEDVAKHLVLSGVRSIGVSIDGASSKTYEAVRIGAKFDRVIENLKRLNGLKKAYNRKNPAVTLIYVMMRQNIHELSEMIWLAFELGANNVVFKNQNVLTKPEDIQEALFLEDQKDILADAQLAVNDALYLATVLGVNVEFHPFESSGTTLCAPNPPKSLFITWDGFVSPCCNLGHRVPRMVGPEEALLDTSLFFGNIIDKPLDEIFLSENYISFRNAFADGYPKECEGCNLVYGV